MIGIVYWFKIIAVEKVTIDENRHSENIRDEIFEFHAAMTSYKAVMAIFLCLQALQLMKHFAFVAGLSMFYEILLRSVADIAFFVVVFVAHIAIFALAGHILFGISDEQFASYGDAVTTVVLFTVGQTSPFEVATTLVALRTIYGLIFVSATLILLNMLAAIVLTHYIEFYVETAGEKVGLLSVSALVSSVGPLWVGL
jgi:hypothetical protein